MESCAQPAGVCVTAGVKKGKGLGTSTYMFKQFALVRLGPGGIKVRKYGCCSSTSFCRGDSDHGKIVGPAGYGWSKRGNRPGSDHDFFGFGILNSAHGDHAEGMSCVGEGLNGFDIIFTFPSQ